MARKKTKNADIAGLWVALVFCFAAIASIPRDAWIVIGTIACLVAVVTWLVIRAKRKRENRPPTSVASMHNRPKVSKTVSEFFTVRLGSTPAASFKIPDAQPQTSDARWVRPDESVTVADFLLPGGLFYVGTTLGRHERHEPSLINPQLRVAKHNVDSAQRLMPYWPSYDAVSPEARRGYLQWLSVGRRDPLADIGYVFLFFYGLERRLLVEAQADAVAQSERPLILQEISRLLDLYGSNPSFRGYAQNLLAYLNNQTLDPELYLHEPPQVTVSRHEVPLVLRIGLGQHAVNKRPLDARWALAWALADPNISKRSPVTRCKEVFSALFMLKYASTHPAGIVLPCNKTKLKHGYRPASARLSVPTLRLGDLPDITATSATRNKLQVLLDRCADELDPYSRYIGKHPDNAQALEGLLQLPVALWPMTARKELDALKAGIEDDLMVMSFGELAGCFQSAETLSRNKTLALARALESYHIGMEPDVLAGSKTPKAQDLIALFATQPEDGSLRACAAYNAACVTLDLASAVASADGETSHEETGLLAQHIDSWAHLSTAHRKRLKAHLQIQIQQPPTLASLKKKLDPLSVEAKRRMASFLAHLAQADGTVNPSEIKLLERVYKVLQLDSQLLYSDLHGAASGGGSAHRSAHSPETVANGQPDGALPQGFALNHERIAQLQRETAEVSALLAQVFTEDQVAQADEVVESTQPAGDTSADVAGLDREHSAFLRLLISRPEWSRCELEDVASDMELMLDGTLEQINDMAFEHFDRPVTEGDDPIIINTDILEELAL